jgi:hypothetical protein
MSNMDRDFITCLIEKGRDGLDIVRKAGIDESFLEDTDSLKVLKFVMEFNSEFHESPAKSVIEKYFGEDFFSEPEQGLEYWLDQLNKRKKYKISALLANQIAEIYNSNDTEDLWQGVDKCVDAITKASRALILETSSSSTGDITKETKSRRETYLERKAANGITGIPTAWNVLTEATMGWQPGHTYMFLAKEGVGKTFHLLMEFITAHEAGYKALFFTEEMTREELAIRADALMTGLDYEEIMKGRLGPEDWAKYEKHLEKLETNPLPMYVNESAGPDGLDYVFELCSQMQPDIVFLDNVTLYFTDLDYKKITPQSNKMKKAAMKGRFPFIFCTHLNDQNSAMYSKALSHDATGVWIMSKAPEQDVMVFSNTKLRYGNKTDFATNWSFIRKDFSELRDYDLSGFLDNLT